MKKTTNNLVFLSFVLISTLGLAQGTPATNQPVVPAVASPASEVKAPAEKPSCCSGEKTTCSSGTCPMHGSVEKQKWTMGGEARFRFETRDNKDLNSTPNDHSSFVGTRVRLNLGFEPSENLKAFVQPQFSEIWGQGTANIAGNGTLTGGVVNSGGFSDPSVNMHQAYANWKVCNKYNLIVGRQELNYGDEVVIGPVGFSNIGRSFDAVLLRSHYGKNTTDFFYSKIADSDVAGTFFTGEFDFVGANSNFAKVSSVDEMDVYGFYLRDRRSGSPTNYNFGTFGVRVKDKFDAFDYRFEGNTQFGEHAGNDMFAYMVDAEAGYTVDWKKGLRFALELNRASGDKKSSSTFTRYHQLFPTVHRWLGYMDLFGRQNIQSGVLHGLLKINKKWTAAVDLHSFWRVEEQDLVYSIVTEAPLVGQAAVPTTGKKHIGEELDMVISYNPVDHIALKAMGGIFIPGAYLKTAVGNDMGYFSYLQTTFTF